MPDIADWMTRRMAEDHRAEMLKQAKKERMVQDVIAAREGRRRFYAPLLARIGERLIATGNYLKRHFRARVGEYATRRFFKRLTRS